MTNSIQFQPLSSKEQMDINGGFVCAGLCLAGAAFVAGAIFGIGIVNGYNAAAEDDNP
jgi:lactobin A/cerein 7B family class IIb bacteriocin